MQSLLLTKAVMRDFPSEISRDHQENKCDTVKYVQLVVPIRNSPPWSKLVFVIYTVPKPSQLNSLPIKSICLQFREKEVVGHHVKGLAEILVDDICSLSLFHWSSHSIVEGQ